MLSEPRIQRYARQILLRDVGGVGQEALGRTGVRLSGQGPLFEAARTYLQAGGTAVAPRTDGAPWAADAALLDGAPHGWLEVGPVMERLAAPGVSVGTRAGAVVLWSMGTDGCLDCLRAHVAGSSSGAVTLTGPAAIVAGGALALLVQRRLLGLAAPLEGLTVSQAGAVQRLEAPRCPHQPPALPPSVLAEVLAHLASTWPEEGCGVLLEGAEDLRFLPLPNAQAAHHARDPAAFPRDARRAFTVEPSTWLRLQTEAEARGEALVVLVHSHPEGPPHFSDEDRRQAAPAGIPLFPGMAYLVVAFQAGVVAKAVWALWRAGGFEEVACPLPGQKPE